MQLHEEFNALNSLTVDRKTLEIMLKKADKEGNLIISKRVAKILHEYNDDKFLVKIINLVEPFGLNAERHSGLEKTGLDDCGRLQPGFYYGKGGKIVKTENKTARKNICGTEKPIKQAVKKVATIKKSTTKTPAQLKIIAENARKLLQEKKLAKEKIAKIIVKEKVVKPKPQFVKTPFDAEIETIKKDLKTETDDKKLEILAKNGNKLIAQRKKFDADQIADFEMPENPYQRILPLSSIYTDAARFQNRNKLNETVLSQIVNNYSTVKLDVLIVWIDKDKKTYLLAGHHRLEASKRKGVKNIAVKYFEGTEAEAIKYAKVESNANRSLELPQERAKIYREMMATETKKNVLELAQKTEGKNANYILNLASLNPKGLVLQMVEQLGETPDKQNATIVERIADWIGQARRNVTELTNAHEKEMFDFLQDKEASLRVVTKVAFLQKITASTPLFFDFENDVLNLKRFKNKTEGETMYDAEFSRLKANVDGIIANRDYLRDRIKNPANKDYIDPNKTANYSDIMKALDVAVEKLNTKLKQAQTALNAHGRQKGYYTNQGSNQVGLFGYIQTQILKTPNLFTNDTPAKIQSKLKIVFEKFNDVKILNLETKKEVQINRVAKGKILFGGATIDTKIATAIFFLPHLITFGKLVNESNPKPHHVKKYNATKILNFQSKLNIDGKTEYFIITIIDRKNIGLHYYIETANIKKSVRLHDSKLRNAKSTLSNGLNSVSKITKSVPKNQTEIKNNFLARPAPPKPRTQSVADRMANRPRNVVNFTVANPEISEFLGKIERKNKESVVITLTGGEGSMKTRMAFQLINAFAQNHTVGHASIEEHPESSLYFDKAEQYLNSQSMANTTAPEIRSVDDLHQLIIKNDVVVIDSFQKMRELYKGFEVDKDLRKKYDGKLFIIIFQQTTDGKMRGGSTSQFDADILLFTEKFDDYMNNYIYATKNRYQRQNLSELKFNISQGKMMRAQPETIDIEHEEITTQPQLQPARRLSFAVR